MSKVRGEREIIAKIRAQVAPEGERLLKGIGDDCAVFAGAKEGRFVTTTDTLVEKVHFDRVWHTPEKLGRKAAAVNLSDIAAMGAAPRYALLSLALPESVAPEWIDSFMDGFLAMLREHDCLLIGGDTVKSQHEIMLTITVIGEAAADEVCYRSGAKVGDLVFVGGLLGEAAAGLALCQRGEQDNEAWHDLIAAHLQPTPQIEFGRVLAQSGLVHAMLDLSDGLATDLAHICKESGVGAEVMTRDIPISDALHRAADFCGHDPLNWALAGGEDYKLLFTVPVAAKEKLQDLVQKTIGCTLFCVGRIVAGSRVYLLNGEERQDITYQGYEHFHAAKK